MKIYWARSMLQYADIQWEVDTKEAIEKQFPDHEIVNPRKMDVPKGTDMEPFLAEVSQAEIVVVSEYNGTIGKGVCAEVSHAFDLGLEVYACRRHQVFRSRFSFPVVKEMVQIGGNWKDKYAQLVVEGKGRRIGEMSRFRNRP